MVAAAHLLREGRDWHGVFIGDGPERAGLQQAAGEPGFQGRIHFPGSHPDPIRLLRDADLFVLPSLSEGLGTSVLDAMALDLPVIASDAGGLPELIGSEAGLVVPAADGEALAGAIGRLLDDPELRRRSVEGGRRTVERYSAAGMASGVRQVYDSISANR
jgi:glycosyltransferase involved in cell wall biosynthesis